MTRHGRLQAIVCVLLPLAILAPLCLAVGASTEHYCACGMKKGECSCSLMMNRAGGHCSGMGMERRCQVRAPRRPVDSEGPRVPLDLRNRLGIFERQGLGLGPEPSGAVEPFAEAFFPPTLAAPPEPPPPRTSYPLS
ncbi:MAG TPA: hypothetical protein VKK31_01605 [Thermoanaerobaculia bacterium]|nr:hypothetical protein [Thermoanaerobaculia bacterium]